MLTPKQTERISTLLDGAADITVATIRDDGAPQATVVSFVHDGVSIYFGTGALAHKAHNIARDNRVAITATCPYETWAEIKGVTIEGLAHRVTAPEEAGKIFALMLKKFPQIGDYVQPQSGADLALFRIEPQRISVLDYAQGFGHVEYLSA